MRRCHELSGAVGKQGYLAGFTVARFLKDDRYRQSAWRRTDVLTSPIAGNVINLRRDADLADSRAHQKVVIVNGNPEMLELVETVLDAGHYDVVFVESNAHAYAEIKRVQPHLVILCLQFDQNDGFRILTMLKLDPETREIPVVTYTTEYGEREEPEAPEPAESEMFSLKPAFRMN